MNESIFVFCFRISGKCKFVIVQTLPMIHHAKVFILTRFQLFVLVHARSRISRGMTSFYCTDENDCQLARGMRGLL